MSRFLTWTVLATALIRAGVNKSNPSVLLPFIACIVAPGTADSG